MTNIFFVHTPFQMFVAQQIINQFGMKDNVLIKSSVGKNKDFYPAFDMMKIEKLWIDEDEFVDISNSLSLKLYKKEELNRNLDAIWKIVRNHNCKNLFLGDYASQPLRILGDYFYKKGYGVCYFEEGTSHYSYSFSPRRFGWVKDLIKTTFRILNFVYYRPRYGFDVMDVGHKYTCVYSILPYFRGKNVISLPIKKLMSNNLSDYLKVELNNYNEGDYNVLLLTECIYLTEPERNYNLLLEVYRNYLLKFPPNCRLWIKFHPRETGRFKSDFRSILKINKIKCKVLSELINIPAEYYLQEAAFDEIVSFAPSTFTYYGYIYQCKKLTSLYSEYIRKAQNNISPHTFNLYLYIKNWNTKTGDKICFPLNI